MTSDRLALLVGSNLVLLGLALLAVRQLVLGH